MSRKPRGIACPHCGQATGVRNSRSMTPLVRQLQLQCVNPECGATFGADLSITHQISPSAIPNPAIMLRKVSAAARRQRRLPAGGERRERPGGAAPGE
jgi:hypothetical protein